MPVIHRILCDCGRHAKKHQSRVSMKSNGWSNIPSADRRQPNFPHVIRVRMDQRCRRTANNIGAQVNDARIHFEYHFQIFIDAHGDFNIRIGKWIGSTTWGLIRDTRITHMIAHHCYQCLVYIAGTHFYAAHTTISARSIRTCGKYSTNFYVISLHTIIECKAHARGFFHSVRIVSFAKCKIHLAHGGTLFDYFFFLCIPHLRQQSSLTQFHVIFPASCAWPG